jgi:PEGA domain
MHFHKNRSSKKHTGSHPSASVRTQERSPRLTAIVWSILLGWVIIFLAGLSYADNKVLGEVVLEGATKVERDSGVWVDNQYLGYLKELKGDKKILLLPGEHEIVVRQDGYLDFKQSVTVEPGQKSMVSVKMERDTRFQMPKVFSEIKLSVNPDRAAVFVDGLFVGHVAEFSGVAHSLLVAPGHRQITISLPGYESFHSDVDLEPNQKFKIQINLVKSATPPGSD